MALFFLFFLFHSSSATLYIAKYCSPGCQGDVYSQLMPDGQCFRNPYDCTSTAQCRSQRFTCTSRGVVYENDAADGYGPCYGSVSMSMTTLPSNVCINDESGKSYMYRCNLPVIQSTISDPDSCPSSMNLPLIVGLSCGGGVLLIIIVAFIVWYRRRRASVPVNPGDEQIKEEKPGDDDDSEEEEEQAKVDVKTEPIEEPKKKPPVTFAKNSQGQWARVIV